MAVTIKDIANLAGVSKTTVSKVINKKDENISDATRQKILNIIKDKKYVPNKVAQSLVTKKTKTIGLVIPDIRNPFFTDISRGVEDNAYKSGYNIILCNTDEDYNREIECMDMLLEKMVDGIVFAPSSNTNEEENRYNDIKTPMVLVDKSLDVSNSKGFVKVDNTNGTYISTRYLIEQGHNKILYISGPLKNEISKERLNGYIKALNENNIKYDENNIIEGKYKIEWAYSLIKNIKEINWTAVCCGNDMIAIGAINGLKERGISIPNDISVIGFDDIQTASLITPPLTTVRQPSYEMGYRACELLINFLENIDDKYTETIFKPQLIKRNSTKYILKDKKSI